MESPRAASSNGDNARPTTSFGSHARRTEARDAAKAKVLIQDYTCDVFGRINREENISSIL